MKNFNQFSVLLVCLMSVGLPVSSKGFNVPSAITTTTTAAAAAPSITNSRQQRTPYSLMRHSSLDDKTESPSTSLSSSLASQLDEILLCQSTNLFDELNDIRENQSQQDVEMFLNEILAIIDNNVNTSEHVSKDLPWWTKMRFTARFSRRARIASLRRVLDLSTPTVEETESLGDDIDAKKRRRRRALVVLLRSLVGTSVDDDEEGDKAIKVKKNGKNTIYKIEKAARKDMMKNISTKDMESRLPPGLETPKYDVIVKRPYDKGGYEVRRYDAFSVCTVPMMKPRLDVETTDEKVKNPNLSGASSFGALAGYLFGKNEDQKAMKMTTPVFTQGEGETKEMSFVLPSNYWSNDGFNNTPKPLQNSLVQVKRDEGGFRAAIMFGGFASKKDVDTKKEQLLNGLSSDKEWMPISDDVALAQYNDPFTPPWKRRNEVSVLIQRRDNN